MADKKINQLNTAGQITANDILGICQNLATGELLQVPAATLRAFILGGANAGARVYFNAGVPAAALGVDGDVCFNTAGKTISSKEFGAWVVKDNYGAPDGGTAIIRFVSVYGIGGLSVDGLIYTNDDLIDGDVVGIMVDASPLIAVPSWGTLPAFDEFDFDSSTGIVRFGSVLPAGFRITITYSF
jgi:hypothetical protein